MIPEQKRVSSCSGVRRAAILALQPLWLAGCSIGGETPTPTPIAMLSESQPRISLPGGDDTVTLHYDAGSSCSQFFDIVYSVESRGQLFQVGNITHPPGQRGSVTVQLLGGGSGVPYVFTVSTHPAGAPPQGQPCPGWTIEVDPQSGAASPAASPSQSG